MGSYPIDITITTTAGTSLYDNNLNHVYGNILNSHTNAIVVEQTLTAWPVGFSPAKRNSFTGTIAEFADSESGGSYSAVIDWGDGTSSTGYVISDGSGGFKVRGTHSYGYEATLSYSVRIIRQNGAQIVVDDQVTVQSVPDLLATEGVRTGDVVLTTFETTAVDGWVDSRTLVNGDDGRNEVQSVSVNDWAGHGTSSTTVSLWGQTATSSSGGAWGLQQALEALPDINPGDVQVTYSWSDDSGNSYWSDGSSIDSNGYWTEGPEGAIVSYVEFTGQYAATDVADLDVTFGQTSYPSGRVDDNSSYDEYSNYGEFQVYLADWDNGESVPHNVDGGTFSLSIYTNTSYANLTLAYDATGDDISQALLAAGVDDVSVSEVGSYPIDITITTTAGTSRAIVVELPENRWC